MSIIVQYSFVFLVLSNQVQEGKPKDNGTLSFGSSAASHPVSRADVSADFGWSLKVTHIRPAVNNYTGVSVTKIIRKEASYYEAGWLDRYTRQKLK